MLYNNKQQHPQHGRILRNTTFYVGTDNKYWCKKCYQTDPEAQRDRVVEKNNAENFEEVSVLFLFVPLVDTINAWTKKIQDMVQVSLPLAPPLSKN